jgi:hypothetical protein
MDLADELMRLRLGNVRRREVLRIEWQACPFQTH